MQSRCPEVNAVFLGFSTTPLFQAELSRPFVATGEGHRERSLAPCDAWAGHADGGSLRIPLSDPCPLVVDTGYCTK